MVMIIDTERMISITEANQNFSKVTKLVDKEGQAVIMKNNKPRYVILDFSVLEMNQTAPEDTLEDISERLLKKNAKVYKELAK